MGLNSGIFSKFTGFFSKSGVFNALKKILKTVEIYTVRGIFSLGFFGSAVTAALLMISFIQSDYAAEFPNLSLYYFYMGAGCGGSDELLIMLAALPAVTFFCEDCGSGRFLLTYSRTGKKIYPFAVTFSAGLVTAVSVIITYLIFSAFILLKYPLVPPIEPAELRRETIGMANSALLVTAPAVFYALWIIREALIAAVYSMLGILLSAFITNVHLTLVSPLILCMMTDIFSRVIKLPFWLDINLIYGGSIGLYRGFGGTLDGEIFSMISAVYPFIFTIFLIILISVITGKVIAAKLRGRR